MCCRIAFRLNSIKRSSIDQGGCNTCRCHLNIVAVVRLRYYWYVHQNWKRKVEFSEYWQTFVGVVLLNFFFFFKWRNISVGGNGWGLYGLIDTSQTKESGKTNRFRNYSIKAFWLATPWCNLQQKQFFLSPLAAFLPNVIEICLEAVYKCFKLTEQ